MITLLIGPPRSGKSTTLAYYALNAIKKGIPVYSNVALKGCYRIEKADLNRYLIENALILWDEGGLEFNSREFKSFNIGLYEFFALHGHYKLDIVIAVQSYNRVDMVLKELCEEVVMVQPTRLDRWFVRTAIIRQYMDIADKKIEDYYDYFGLLQGGIKYFRHKKPRQMFDSWYRPRELEYKKFSMYSPLEFKDNKIKRFILVLWFKFKINYNYIKKMYKSGENSLKKVYKCIKINIKKLLKGVDS